MTKTVFEQIMKVRETGKANMFDVVSVIRIAFGHEWFELAEWLSRSENAKEYVELIFSGKPKIED